jgi:hypothetical protein
MNDRIHLVQPGQAYFYSTIFEKGLAQRQFPTGGVWIGHPSVEEIIPSDFGSVQLHMWRANLRGKGYGPPLFCLTAPDFYERFKLERPTLQSRVLHREH